MFDVQNISKAIAAGIVGAIIAVAARYGLHANGPTISAVGVIVTAVVGYVIAHIVTYLAPANKPKGVK